MIRLLQTKGVVAIACLPLRDSLRVGILILDGTASNSGAADLVDRDNPHSPRTMVFLPQDATPGIYFDQVLEFCPF